MIAGRNVALWLGLVQAGINVLVVVAGVTWTAEQIAALNAFAAAAVAVLAQRETNAAVIAAVTAALAEDTAPADPATPAQ